MNLHAPRPLIVALLVASASSLAPALASAQPKGKRSNVVELSEITITGRVQKPVAAVDIARIAPKLSLAELRQPFLDKIEQAVYGDPF